MELDNKIINGSSHINNISSIGLIRSSSSSTTTTTTTTTKKIQNKQKKVPQRGLGVAQLEKIRLEEQQKIKSPSTSPPNNNPNNHHHHHHSYMINNSSSSDHMISSSSSPNNSLLRLQKNTIDLYNHSNINPFQLGPNSHNIINWNSNSYDQKENCELLDPPLANFRLAGEYSNPMWPLHSLIQRSSHYHQSPPSMMNVSSRSSSSSSLLNLHMELPSNQNNSYSVPPALLPEEELKVQMVGMKRSYPFALDNSTAINGATTNFRGCSGWDSAKKNKKENGDFNGDFLTLGPPPITALTSSNNSNLLQIHPPPPFYNCQSFDFTSLPYQGIIEDEIDEARSEVVQPFYSFIPPAIIQIGQPIITTCNNGTDFGDNVVDLNLKL